jgi:hypothetical protein
MNYHLIGLLAVQLILFSCSGKLPNKNPADNRLIVLANTSINKLKTNNPFQVIRDSMLASSEDTVIGDKKLSYALAKCEVVFDDKKIPLFLEFLGPLDSSAMDSTKQIFLIEKKLEHRSILVKLHDVLCKVWTNSREEVPFNLFLNVKVALLENYIEQQF